MIQLLTRSLCGANVTVDETVAAETSASLSTKSTLKSDCSVCSLSIANNMEQDQIPIPLAQHESATRSGIETSAVPQPAWDMRGRVKATAYRIVPKDFFKGSLTELLHCIFKMADRWILAGSVPFLENDGVRTESTLTVCSCVCWPLWNVLILELADLNQRT